MRYLIAEFRYQRCPCHLRVLSTLSLLHCRGVPTRAFTPIWTLIEGCVLGSDLLRRKNVGLPEVPALFLHEEVVGRRLPLLLVDFVLCRLRGTAHAMVRQGLTTHRQGCPAAKRGEAPQPVPGQLASCGAISLSETAQASAAKAWRRSNTRVSRAGGLRRRLLAITFFFFPSGTVAFFTSMARMALPSATKASPRPESAAATASLPSAPPPPSSPLPGPLAAAMCRYTRDRMWFQLFKKKKPIFVIRRNPS